MFELDNGMATAISKEMSGTLEMATAISKVPDSVSNNKHGGKNISVAAAAAQPQEAAGGTSSTTSAANTPPAGDNTTITITTESAAVDAAVRDRDDGTATGEITNACLRLCARSSANVGRRE